VKIKQVKVCAGSPRPSQLMNSEKYLKYKTNQTENTDVSNLGFGRRPDRRTTISNDHISKLSYNNARDKN
jgi:hypothetical protein